MTDYTSITISKDGLADLHEKKEAYYGEIADEVSLARFIQDATEEVTGDGK